MTDDPRRERMVLGIAKKWHNIARHLSRSYGDDILQAGRLAYVESGGDPAAVNRAMVREAYFFSPRSRNRNGENSHPSRNGVMLLDRAGSYDPTASWLRRISMRDARLSRDERLCLVGPAAGFSDAELAAALGFSSQGARSRGVVACRERARRKVLACAS